MDFAPYQDSAPEQERALSPDRRGASRSPQPRSPPPQRNLADPFLTSNNRGYHDDNGDDGAAAAADGSYQAGATSFGGFGGGDDPESGRGALDLFQTSLPLRMDYEAMLAYLLLPPAGGVILLILEHRSDYVRFHAWQSSLIFSAAFVLHLIFTFNGVLSWLLFAVDVIAIGFLALRAYRDADTLDRFEVPFFGRLASSFVDDE